MSEDYRVARTPDCDRYLCCAGNRQLSYALQKKDVPFEDFQKAFQIPKDAF